MKRVDFPTLGRPTMPQATAIQSSKPSSITYPRCDEKNGFCPLRSPPMRHTLPAKVAEQVKGDRMIVRAEWPGYVVDVLVRPGQEVEEDEPLMILEGTDSSRTSFYINAPEGGKVREVLIEEGDFAYEDDDLVVIGDSDRDE